MRIKEQQTRLTLQKHDDDDDNFDFVVNSVRVLDKNIDHVALKFNKGFANFTLA